MPTETAATYTHAIPCLRYDDANAAIRWLAAALGAEVRHVHPAPDGRVAHAELWFGGACVMLGSTGVGALTTRAGEAGCTYLVLPSATAVDAAYGRAREAGARMVIELHDTDYGSRDFACGDPEGNLWSVGSYAPA